MNVNGLSAISSLNIPHSFAYATETNFLKFKEQVPFHNKNKISAVEFKRKTFRLIAFSAPVYSR
jgi:hypothetical protein